MNRKLWQAPLCLLLCIVLLICSAPMASASGEKYATRLVELSELSAKYLSASDDSALLYPGGEMMLSQTSAELKMNGFYAVDILRRGGTQGEAKIKLSTIDLSAAYKDDYRLYLSKERGDKGVSGEKRLYFYDSGVPYIAALSDVETVYGGDDADDEETAQINENSAESMPHSSETVLTFEDGENIKTVYIETKKKNTVTDDLEFMLAVSEPENCSVSTYSTAVFKIVEEREKPAAELSVSDTVVNPESGTAYVSVKRSGNLGGYTSFRFTTQSGTAVAEEDYHAVAQDLKFVPNLREIEVPISLMEGASEGESFSVEISNPSKNTELAASSANVIFDADGGLADTGAYHVSKYVTSFTYKTTDYRQYEFVDLSKFHYEKVLGDSGNKTAKYESGKYRLDYKQSSWKNHAVDAMSPEKISFFGVNKVHFCFDNKSGSIASDHSAVVIAEINPLDNNDNSCNWMGHLGSNGVSWGMGNISSSHLTKDITLSDSDKRHNNWIYLVLNKSGFWGNAGVKFHDYNGSLDCSFRLDLQPYTVDIIDPEAVQIYKNGKLETVNAITDAQFTDPGSTGAKYTTSATFYRYDATSFKVNCSSDTYGAPKLKGIYFCNPGNHSKRSALMTLSSPSFTLTPDILKLYSYYFENNHVCIQPVYEFDTADVTVNSYEDTERGVKFKADSAACEGTFYLNGKKFGTLNWTKSERSGGSYYDGDTIRFDFTPADVTDGYSVSCEYRVAQNKADLSSAAITTVTTGTDTIVLSVKNKFMTITPLLSNFKVKTKLRVFNPENGSYTGEGTKFAAKNNDGSVTVTGYTTSDGDIDFSGYKAGQRLGFTAAPKSGYYAEWIYTDAATREKKTYSGNEFYYVVQNPTVAEDNTVELHFIRVTSLITNFVNPVVTGKIQIPKSTVLHPASSSSKVMAPAENAVIYMDNYVGTADENGNFTLMDNLYSDSQEMKTAKVKLRSTLNYLFLSKSRSVNETHRALVFYNSNYYVCDVRLYTSKTAPASIGVNVVLDSSAVSGVIPTSANAYSPNTGVYGDIITLVNAENVNFSVDFDARNIDRKKPVNMARWTIIGENGMVRDTLDKDVDAGSSVARLSIVAAEKAMQGDTISIEFFNKSYNSGSNPVYTSYGRYELGYSFVNANIEKAVSYMPDLGYYDDGIASTSVGIDGAATGYATIPSVPAIGPFSPLVSIFGFLPIYSDEATGEKDAATGEDLYCLNFGVQFSVARSQTGTDDASWGTASFADKAKALGKVLAKKAPEKAIQSMQTSTKISLAISFTYQLNYYTVDGGTRHYVSAAFALGANIGVHFTIPFVLLYIPCFVYVDISANNVGYLVFTPKSSETEGYWTSDMLMDKKYFDTHGEFSQVFNVGFGAGVGYDGLLSVGGNLDFKFTSKLSTLSTGKLVFSLHGGVFANLVFHKVSKSWQITDKTLIDTEADKKTLAAVAANIVNSENEEWFDSLTLGDFTYNGASDEYTASVDSRKDADIASTGSAQYISEVYVEENTASVNPVIGKLYDSEYLVATVYNTDAKQNSLRYFLYNPDTNEITASGDAVDDLLAAEAFKDADPEMKNEIARSSELVDEIRVIDCGDELFLMWSSVDKSSEEDLTFARMLQSVKVYGMFFDKSTKTFRDFSAVNIPDNTLSTNLKGVYNENTGMLYLCYENMDTSSVTDGTTVNQINSLPAVIDTVQIDKNGNRKFTEPVELATAVNTVSDYDVIAYGENMLLSYVGADTASRIVEMPVDEEFDVNSDDFGTENDMYLNQYAFGAFDEERNTAPVKTVSSILIADANYVTANPEFVRVDADDTENILLFYKCNGRYGYQNIDNVYSHYYHANWDTVQKLRGDSMAPAYITDDEDHAVGEDFKVFSQDGTVYAFWTTAQGAEQQIWGRQFTIDSVEQIDEVPRTDEDGEVVYASGDTPVMEKLDQPIKILGGLWGEKTKLTEGGLGDTDTGMFKGKFDISILDPSHVLAVYNSFDYDYGNGEENDNDIKVINNRFVIAEYNTDCNFETGDSGYDAVSVSNSYPMPGEAITVTARAKHTGFNSDVNIPVYLLVNNKVADKVVYEYWSAEDEKETVFEYTVPYDSGVENLVIGYQVGDTGFMGNDSPFRCEPIVLKPSFKLTINNAHATPVKVIDGNSDAAAYYVTAEIYNTGNVDYDGSAVLNFVNHDLAEEADVLNESVKSDEPFYTNYGYEEIPPIAAGSKTEVAFVTEDIPEKVFDKYNSNSANLCFVITPEDGVSWTEIKGDDRFNFLDEFGVGQFTKPVPEEVEEIRAESVSVPMGSSCAVMPTVYPVTAAMYAQLSYQSSDTDIVTVDENGVLTGLKEGTATVTVSSGEVETKFEVTVTHADLLLGDANLDDEVNITDATTIQRYDCRVMMLSELALKLADVDRDGDVCIIDATWIQRYEVGVKAPDGIGKTI